MMSVLYELITLLDSSQRKRLFALQILIVCMSLTEIVGVASIAPFMAVVTNTGLLEGDGILAKLYAYSGITSVNWFIFLLGVAVLATLGISTCISMITLWRLSLFAFDVGAELSDRLYTYYVHQPWLFHVSTTSAKLTKQITTETQRVTQFLLLPFVQFNARIVLIVCMSSALIVYDPTVAIVGLVVFSLSYWIIYKFVKHHLYRNGQNISNANEKRYQLLNNGIGGIRDTLLLHRQPYFVTAFSLANRVAARSSAINNVLGMAPKYILELVAFGSAIVLVLFLIKTNTQNMSVVIPILSVYALAGLKLLPAFQQTYSAVATIKGSVASFEALKDDLYNSKVCTVDHSSSSSQALIPTTAIVLDDVFFCYPGKEQSALHSVHATIQANQIVGVVGASGSGKSTLIDILLGLITPDKGQLCVDGIPITKANRRAWQNTLGFVSQSIFLVDGTIAENIAFGLPKEKIDQTRLHQAIQRAHLGAFVDNLPQGADTQVGERGMQLSGGQRQRIGIARALYQHTKVLLFDEATSALDGITEKLVMNAIHDFGGKKTIILVAHRLQTVKQCDVIFIMDKGKIVDSGTFQSLVKNNAQFASMAGLA